jgi:hypothetical protein
MTGILSYKGKGELRCYYSFFWCFYLAVAAVITDIPDGEPAGGLGIVGTVLVIVLVVYLLGGLR